MQVLPYAVAALVVGLFAEAGARVLNAWRYRKPWLVLVNLVVMYGGVMGVLASQLPRQGLVRVALGGAIAGLLYEIVNLRWVGWWEFPEGRMLWLRGRTAILAALTVAWGTVPPVAWALRVAWPADRSARTLQERFDSLVDAEERLLEKLRVVQERQDILEARLEAVRAKKRYIEGHLTIRDPREAVPEEGE